MSKWSNFQSKLLARPTPADIKWHELQGFLVHLGYTVTKGKGSRRRFFHEGKNALICCHEPHPSPDVKKSTVADIVSHLQQQGLI